MSQLGGVMFLLVMMIMPVAQAAYISEIFLGGGEQGQVNALEVSAMDDNEPYELVIIDNTPGFANGFILQVIRFQAANQGTLLIAESTWPTHLYAHPGDAIPQVVTLNNAQIETSSLIMNLKNEITLLLFQGHTSFRPMVNYNHLPSAVIEEAILQDTVQLDIASGSRFAEYAEMQLGDVWSRPLEPASRRPGIPLVGPADLDGRMKDNFAYTVTPGLPNRVLTQVPEPISFSLLVMLMLCMIRRPCKIKICFN